MNHAHDNLNNVLRCCYKERKADDLQNLPSDYIVFDTETTGLDPASHQIIEIGAIKYKNHEKIAEYSQLINPQCMLPPFITQLTGIMDKDLRNMPVIKAVLPEFFAFIEDYTLIAHNASYDVRMLAGEAYRSNTPLFNNKVIDSVVLARRVIPKTHVPNHQLTTLKDFFGLSNYSHRALDDCETCAAIYQYYCSCIDQ